MKTFAVALIVLFAGLARAENVLIVGDSHSVGPFGKELERLLTEGSHTVERRATSGASSKDWLNRLEVLRAPVDKSDLIIIALGTNDANQTDCANAEDSGLFAYATRTAKNRCVWIGPPNFPQGPIAQSCGAKYNAYVDLLAATVKKAGCVFFDSRTVKVGQKVLAPNENDQLHFREDLAKIWASEAVKTISPSQKP